MCMFFHIIKTVQYSTDFGSNGMTRKPDGSKGASSPKDSSIGAKTSCAQAPAAFSSMPLHSCHCIKTYQNQIKSEIFFSTAKINK